MLAAVKRYQQLSDDDLVCRYIGGDGRAAEVLWQRHERLCRGIARKVVRGHDNVEEALAQARLTVLEEVGGYRPGTRYIAWLRQVAWTNALDVARANRRCPLPGSTDDRWSWLVDQAGEVPEDVSSDLHERGGRLRPLIDQLIPRLLDVVWMRAVGASIDTIAAVLGVPMGTVKSRLGAARMQLRELERDAQSAGEV